MDHCHRQPDRGPETSLIAGSDLYNRTAANLNPPVVTPDLPPDLPAAGGMPLSFEVAKNTDVTPTNPIVAAGKITIEDNSAAPAGAVIDLQGVVQSTGAGDISVTSLS